MTVGLSGAQVTAATRLEKSVTCPLEWNQMVACASQNARAYENLIYQVLLQTVRHKIWAVGGSERYGNGAGHGVIERYRP